MSDDITRNLLEARRNDATLSNLMEAFIDAPYPRQWRAIAGVISDRLRELGHEAAADLYARHAREII